MLKKMAIKPYKHNARCEMYLCTNRAVHAIGDEKHPTSTTINLCDECLQEIVNIVPISMIKARPDIENVTVKVEVVSVTDKEPVIEQLPFTDVPEVKEEVKKEVPKDFSMLSYTKDYEDMKMNELIEKGKQLGIKYEVGTKKPDFIKMLRQAENG